jgi:hypothetical protein
MMPADIQKWINWNIDNLQEVGVPEIHDMHFI